MGFYIIQTDPWTCGHKLPIGADVFLCQCGFWQLEETCGGNQDEESYFAVLYLFIYLVVFPKSETQATTLTGEKKPHKNFNPVKDQQHLLKGVTGHRTGLDDL